MNKETSAREELIAYLLSMTPEQLDKFFNHPITKQIIADNECKKEAS